MEIVHRICVSMETRRIKDWENPIWAEEKLDFENIIWILDEMNATLEFEDMKANGTRQWSPLDYYLQTTLRELLKSIQTNGNEYIYGFRTIENNE